MIMGMAAEVAGMAVTGVGVTAAIVATGAESPDLSFILSFISKIH
jgi:hypothetical protein